MSVMGLRLTILSHRAFVRECNLAPAIAILRKVGWSLSVDLTIFETGFATVLMKRTPNLKNRDILYSFAAIRKNTLYLILLSTSLLSCVFVVDVVADDRSGIDD